jgi:hypothetical protein
MPQYGTTRVDEGAAESISVVLKNEQDKPVLREPDVENFQLNHQRIRNLCSNEIKRWYFKHLWKAKIHLKSKFWLWLI